MSTFSNLKLFFNSISTNFPNPNFFLEQYSTPIDILEVYFDFLPPIHSSIIVDLGVGTGILSFLALRLGAQGVIGIDIDRQVLQIARKNASLLNIQNLNLIHSSVEFFKFEKFANNINGVIMNPPFGTKRKFLDFVFLKRAMQTRGWVLTLHKSNNESDRKISTLCSENKYIISNKKKLIFNLPNTHKNHILNTYEVEVALYLLTPNV